MKHVPQKVTWPQKFANAFRGLAVGVRGQNSFWVHLPAGLAVLGLGLAWGLDTIRFGLLLLCIAAVISSEFFNSALEILARVITDEHDERIRDALDIASGAVLTVSLFAVAIAVLVFLF